MFIREKLIEPISYSQTSHSVQYGRIVMIWHDSRVEQKQSSVWELKSNVTLSFDHSNHRNNQHNASQYVTGDVKNKLMIVELFIIQWCIHSSHWYVNFILLSHKLISIVQQSPIEVLTLNCLYDWVMQYK